MNPNTTALNEDSDANASIESVRQWLTRLRFGSDDVATYTNNLRASGFDDIQSICEDAEMEDLRAAGMLPGHARRLLKAAQYTSSHLNSTASAASGCPPKILRRSSSQSSNVSSSSSSPPLNCTNFHSSTLPIRGATMCRPHSSNSVPFQTQHFSSSAFHNEAPSASSTLPATSPFLPYSFSTIGNGTTLSRPSGDFAGSEVPYTTQGCNSVKVQCPECACNFLATVVPPSFSNVYKDLDGNRISTNVVKTPSLKFSNNNMTERETPSTVSTDADVVVQPPDPTPPQGNTDFVNVRDSSDGHTTTNNVVGASPHPNTWDVGGVVTWLKQFEILDAEEIFDAVLSHDINGFELLNEDEQSLTQKLGIFFGPHRRFFSRELQKLKNHSAEESSRYSRPHTNRAKAAVQRRKNSKSPVNHATLTGANDDDDIMNDDKVADDEDAIADELSVATGLEDSGDFKLRCERETVETRNRKYLSKRNMTTSDSGSSNKGNNDHHKGKQGKAKVFSKGAAKHVQAPPMLSLNDALTIDRDGADQEGGNIEKPGIELETIVNDFKQPYSDNTHSDESGASFPLQYKSMDRSYEFSDGGTLFAGGFNIKPSGIAQVPADCMQPISEESHIHHHCSVKKMERNDCEGRDGSMDRSDGSGSSSCGSDSIDCSDDDRDDDENDEDDDEDCSGIDSDSENNNSSSGNNNVLDKKNLPVVMSARNITGTKKIATPLTRRTQSAGPLRRDRPFSGLRTPRNSKDEIIILKEVGRGACGVVHEALHIPTMKLVAVKSVTVNDSDKRKQMIKELTTMHGMCSAELDPETDSDSNHPHIVSFYDAYTDPEKGCVKMVLEYMNAGTLQDLVSAGINVTEKMLASVASSVLRGLVDVHKSKQIHRDIKPSNILLDRDGHIKISDFGIARKLEHSISMASTFTGTLTYMSPERISGQEYSYPSDIWSLGLCLATLALGRYPFPTDSGYWGVVQAIQDDDPPKVAPGRFGPYLQDFLNCCLEKDPCRRLSAEGLLKHDFLQRYSNSPLSAPAPPDSSPKKVRALSELAKTVIDFFCERALSSAATKKHLGETRNDLSDCVPNFDANKLDVLAGQLGMPVEVLVEVFGTEAEKGRVHLGAEDKPKQIRRTRTARLSAPPHGLAPIIVPNDIVKFESSKKKSMRKGFNELAVPPMPLSASKLRRVSSREKYIRVALNGATG